MKTPYRPPSLDLPAEFYRQKLKPCPMCGSRAELIDCDEIIVCTKHGCRVIGPNDDPKGVKWNSIPRRPEVLELLRLVGIVHKAPLGQWYEWQAQRKKLIAYADKLREEMGG